MLRFVKSRIPYDVLLLFGRFFSRRWPLPCLSTKTLGKTSRFVALIFLSECGIGMKRTGASPTPLPAIPGLSLQFLPPWGEVATLFLVIAPCTAQDSS